MNKILKTLFLCLVSLGIASCDNEVGYPDNGPQGNPEKEIEGTYTGTWTKTVSGAETGDSATGTLTFTPEGQFITEVLASCSDLDINFSSNANVVNYSEGYMFYNAEAKNGFGTSFDGRVINGQATIKFTISIKVGLKQTIYNYTFTGEKN